MLLLLSMLAANPPAGNWRWVVDPSTTCTSSIVYFAPGSDRFDAASILSLSGSASGVQDPRARPVKLLVIGYVGPNPAPADTRLAQRRVNRVRAYLVSWGVAPNRVGTELRRDDAFDGQGRDPGVVVDALTPLADMGRPRGSGGAC